MELGIQILLHSPVVELFFGELDMVYPPLLGAVC